MRDAIVVINAGSSSVKFALFATAPLDRIASGAITGIGSTPHFTARRRDGSKIEQRWDRKVSHSDLLLHLLAWIEKELGPQRLLGAGHRIVHGGVTYSAPVLLSAEVLTDLHDTIPLAPLHEPHNLAPVVALAALHPQLPQVGCFDTAFHTTNSRISQLYALPHALADAGIHRYGFHGLSYEYIAAELPHHDARAAAGRCIVAHLGNGASLCALVAGKSVATSMGFSALDGLPMGTRCGAVDPGVLLYLLREKGLDVEGLTNLLYYDSGLLGLSGISSDMRELLASTEARARDAVEVFVYRAAREIGSLLAAAGGLDALVFTAGIGERAAEIRARICAQLEWLGVRLDATANAANATQISAPDSAVSVWVIPTDEELMIARHTAALIGIDAS